MGSMFGQEVGAVAGDGKEAIGFSMEAEGSMGTSGRGKAGDDVRVTAIGAESRKAMLPFFQSTNGL
jgi:hypothetical protein